MDPPNIATDISLSGILIRSTGKSEEPSQSEVEGSSIPHNYPELPAPSIPNNVKYMPAFTPLTTSLASTKHQKSRVLSSHLIGNCNPSPLRAFLTNMEKSQVSKTTSTQHSILPHSNKQLPNIQVMENKQWGKSDRDQWRRPWTPAKPITQHAGFSKAQKYSHIDEPWGHLPEEIDTSAVFRVLLQNPNGLKLSEGDKMARYSFSESFHLGVGALCLPETNTNWNLPSSMNHQTHLAEQLHPNISHQRQLRKHIPTRRHSYYHLQQLDFNNSRERIWSLWAG